MRPRNDILETDGQREEERGREDGLQGKRNAGRPVLTIELDIQIYLKHRTLKIFCINV